LWQVPADCFQHLHDGKVVGRMYRMNSVGHELWRWTTIDWYPPGPNGGVADTLEAAKTAFRNAWDMWHSPHCVRSTRA
jgi:hypothetical protein